MRIDVEPIGIIKKAGKYSEILIYSDFEGVLKNMMSRMGNNSGQDILIVHKNGKLDNGHQVTVTKATLVEKMGNILKVNRINAHDDPVIDVCLDEKKNVVGHV
jgi:hypothetical protein